MMLLLVKLQQLTSNLFLCKEDRKSTLKLTFGHSLTLLAQWSNMSPLKKMKWFDTNKDTDLNLQSNGGLQSPPQRICVKENRKFLQLDVNDQIQTDVSLLQTLWLWKDQRKSRTVEKTEQWTKDKTSCHSKHFCPQTPKIKLLKRWFVRCLDSILS